MTVNSDDPAYFPGYVNENMLAFASDVQLGRDDVVQLAKNAFTISWLPDEDKQHYIEALDEYADGRQG